MGTPSTAPSTTEQRPRWLDAVADPVRLLILRTLYGVEDATAPELAARSQASYQTLRRHLEVLEASGIIQTRPGESDGETSGRPATRYSLAPDVRESMGAMLGI